MNSRQIAWARASIVSLLCAYLAGCGGGGGEDAATPTTQTPQGGLVADVTPIVLPPVVTAPVPPATPTPPASAPAVDYSQPVTKVGMKAQDRIGVNLAGVSDYSSSHEFVDLLMQSRGFGAATEPWSTTKTVRLDPTTGWPLEDFGIVVFVEQQNTTGLGGTYTVKFKGPETTSMALIAGTPGSVSSRTYNATTGEHTLLMTFPEGGAKMFLSFTGTQGRLTDLRIIRPGYDASNPPTFTKHYLDHIARFSTLRFMDWMTTNDPNVATTWATRPTPITKRAANQQGMAPGMSWERAIELANVSSSDMWINVPLNADANYIRELAKLIKRTLAPNLKVYVEYSNEVWNSSFVQLTRTRDAALAALAASPVTTKIAYDGNTNQWYLANRYFAELSMQMSDIFRSEFPNDMMTRIRPVLAWRATGAGTGADILAFPSAAYGKSAGQYFYGFAGAPYYNMGDQQSVDGLSIDQVVTALAGRVTAAPKTYYYEWNVMLARKYNMQFIGYEGGPDTAHRDGGSLEAKAGANRDARMFDMCKNYLNDWSEAGGGLFMWFHSGAGSWNSKFGSWALVEGITDNNGPKIRCMSWAATTTAPALKIRHNVGQFIDTAMTAESDSNTARQWWTPAAPQPPLERNYLVGAPDTACYKLTLTTMFSGATGATIDVSINGEKNLTVGPIPRSTVSTDLVAGNVCLTKGPNTVSFKAVAVPSSGFIERFKLEPLL